MPRRQGRAPVRNPRGLGAEQSTDDSSDDSVAAAPARNPRNASARNQRRSLSESSVRNRGCAADRSQSRPRAASAARMPPPAARMPPPARRGANALNEISYYQRGTNLLIPKLSFGRVIREVLQQYANQNMRITAECLMALQEASEIFLVQVFEDCQCLALHRQRVTITKKDMELAMYFRSRL